MTHPPFLPLISPCRTVIVAAGDFPLHETALSMLQQAETLVCCDGAASNLLQYGMEPHQIVGDMDSLSPTLRQRFHERILHIPSQDCNDLAKALRFCIRNQLKDICLLGISGKREDHSLANLSILLEYSLDANIQAFTDYGVFNPIRQTTVFESVPQQQVSVFSFTPATLFTFHGLKYPVTDAPLVELWQGSLNEACGKEFTIQMSEGKALVFRVFPSVKTTP
ncbi:MAG: thiamine diphosphokinase [Bacteroidales bacterium]|nr:thiamine diphosphokinase [Bacteroidales bacterium]